jgi:putative membrane protein
MKHAHVHKIAVLAAALGLALSAQAQYSSSQSTQKTAPTPPASSSSASNAATAPSASTPQRMAASSSTSSMSSSAQPATSLAHADKSFMEKAAEGGMAEVETAKLAQQKAQAPEVKQFADRMVQDHTKANDQLKQIASSKQVQLPDKMDKSAQKEMDRLQKLSGAQFDQEYMKHEVSDHKKDVKEFQKEAKSAKDADVKRFASETLPTLEEHLKMAQNAENVARNESRTNMAAKTTK